MASLIPSATEIVCALGFEDALVGRSHECDYPPTIGRLPVLTAPKFDPVGTSREIDDRVKALLRDSLSVYRVFDDRLRELRPDVLITQSQCDVCAVNLRDVEAAVCGWLDVPARIVSLEPMALADLWTDIARVAEALDAPDSGAALVGRLRERMAAIADRAQRCADRPRVAFVEWLDPLMAGGNWMPELIEWAGATALFGQPGVHSPWIEWEELREADPDVIVIAPCGFDIERIRQELHLLTERPGWAALTAVRTGRVFIADGNQYFNRPGPRLAESLEILAEAIHPDVFDFGHRGQGWTPLAG